MVSDNSLQKIGKYTDIYSDSTTADKKPHIDMDHKQSDNRNDNNISKDKKNKNLKLFSRSFWGVFIGTSLVSSLILYLSNIFNKEKETILNSPNISELIINGERKIPVARWIIEANKYLKNNLDKLLAEVAKKTYSDLEKLHRKYLRDFKIYTFKSLNHYFFNVEKRNIPRFLNWLYSWGTDYAVAYHSALKLLRGQDNYLQRKIETLLFNPKEFNAYLNSHIVPYTKILYINFLTEVENRFQENFKKLAKEELEKAHPEIPKVVINDIVVSFYSDNEELIKQWYAKSLGIKSAIEISTAVVLITRLSEKLAFKTSLKVSKKFAAKLVEKIGAKMAVKLGGKVVGGGSAFVAGMAACLEIGPFAVACGAAAALAAELVTDYALTRLDEAITRDTTRLELKNLLEETKLATYKKLVNSFEFLLNDVEKKFLSTTLVDFIK